MIITIQSCCGQAPQLWQGGNWTCSECGSILPEHVGQLEIDWGSTVPKLPTKTVCDCGGAKANTTHAFWCSVYVK